MKFKVGDKVKLNTNSLNLKFRAGETVTIDYIDDCGSWGNKVSKGGDKFDWIADEWTDLELVSKLPFNITFKNKYEHQAVQQFLFDQGCRWAGTGETIEDYKANPITVDEQKYMSNNYKGYIQDENKNYPTYTIANLETMAEILKQKPITEFKLNAEYTAIIDPNTETVKVGCQTFTYATVKELASKL